MGTLNKKIQLLNTSGRRFEFLLNDSNDQEAANLRKAMLAYIPTMAVMQVEIQENTSIMVPDMILQRFEMIYFNSENADQFCYARDCECKDKRCSKCTVGFEIDVTNVDSVKPLPVQVFQTQMKLLPEYETTAKGVSPLFYVPKPPGQELDDNDLTIVELSKGQRVHLHIFVQKGTTKRFRHTKFKPTTVVSFRLDPTITFNDNLLANTSMEQRLKIVMCCPKKIFSLSEFDGSIVVNNPRKCTSCQECIHVCKEITTTIEEIEDLGHNQEQHTSNINATPTLNKRVTKEKTPNIEKHFNSKKEQPTLIKVDGKKGCYYFNVKCNGTVSPMKILELACKIAFTF